MSPHHKLDSARLLANAAKARRRARMAMAGSYTEAQALSERRWWLILARKQLAQRKEGPAR